MGILKSRHHWLNSRIPAFSDAVTIDCGCRNRYSSQEKKTTNLATLERMRFKQLRFDVQNVKFQFSLHKVTLKRNSA